MYEDVTDAWGRTGQGETCMMCYGSGHDYDETCLTCGGLGFVVYLPSKDKEHD